MLPSKWLRITATAQTATAYLLSADENDKTRKIALTCNKREFFAAHLKAYRKKARLTQHELAETIGATLCTVRAWEEGKTTPGYRLREKLYSLFSET